MARWGFSPGGFFQKYFKYEKKKNGNLHGPLVNGWWWRVIKWEKGTDLAAPVIMATFPSSLPMIVSWST